MKDKLKAILASIWADIVDTYKRSKLLLLAIGAIIVALEFNKIKKALEIYSAKKELQKSQKKDAELASKEKDANDQANALIAKAKQAPSDEKPVDDNWYKK